MDDEGEGGVCRGWVSRTKTYAFLTTDRAKLREMVFLQTEGVLAALIKPVQGGWWVESRSTSTSRRGAVVPQSPNEIELCSTTVWRRVRNSCEDALSKIC